MDYFPPIERFVIMAGSSRACLTFVIRNDDQVEGMESLMGNLEGIITETNTLDPNPDRITFNPRDATLNILDTDSKYIHSNSGSMTIDKVISTSHNRNSLSPSQK